MKKLLTILYAFMIIFSETCLVKAQSLSYPSKNYTIQTGDSLWKIAVKNQVRVLEIVGITLKFQTLT